MSPATWVYGANRVTLNSTSNTTVKKNKFSSPPRRWCLSIQTKQFHHHPPSVVGRLFILETWQIFGRQDLGAGGPPRRPDGPRRHPSARCPTMSFGPIVAPRPPALHDLPAPVEPLYKSPTSVGVVGAQGAAAEEEGRIKVQTTAEIFLRYQKGLLTLHRMFANVTKPSRLF